MALRATPPNPFVFFVSFVVQPTSAILTRCLSKVAQEVNHEGHEEHEGSTLWEPSLCLPETPRWRRCRSFWGGTLRAGPRPANSRRVTPPEAPAVPLASRQCRRDPRRSPRWPGSDLLPGCSTPVRLVPPRIPSCSSCPSWCILPARSSRGAFPRWRKRSTTKDTKSTNNPPSRCIRSEAGHRVLA